MNISRSTITSTLLVLSAAMVWLFVANYHHVVSTRANAWYEDQQADCAIALTGGTGRVREGLDLLAHGSIKKLIISGVNPHAQLREFFAQRPFYPEINDADVILERKSTTTYGNAHQSLPLAEALHCRSLLLITSRLHMYRASRTFNAALPEGILLHERAVVSGDYNPDFSEAFSETLKTIFYSVWAY